MYNYGLSCVHVGATTGLLTFLKGICNKFLQYLLIYHFTEEKELGCTLCTQLK